MLDQDYDQNVRGDASEQDQPGAELGVPAPRSPSAARLLEMTARETDQWRADARAEADGIVAAAREEAAEVARAAQADADTMREDARRAAEKTIAEARAEAEGIRTEASEQRAHEESEVARLQQVAAEHSEQLRRHLTDMLGRLDAVPGQSERRDGSGE
ncbi:hypothetical protein KDN32_08230 [Nocardioides sp. J2M5]|uniref:hypothetical protein n=1 Tax=Nocardioides palaemonis TaxID=2829810 RepID=UPI001BAC4FB7|nr:hypothetical protein [Nocardioides palaemonis]MBS2937728.1 hypothetical protein [Nocardioides palaemonis]